MTMTRARRHFTRPLALTLGAFALAGCVSTSPDATGRYTYPIGGAPVITNETPYSRGLECLAGYNVGRPAPRIAVGMIADYTGKEEADGSGRKITQGAALMAISALSKAGVRLVERFDTSVAELELKYANNKLIGEDEDPDYRKILAGSIPGSDFYLVGGITELNFNLRSQGASIDGGGLRPKEVKGSLAGNIYVMNVGLDLRLVDTKSLEVIDVISYQKQIVARQIEAGIFDVLGTSIVTAGVGDSALEPIQLAVRAVIERAVLEMISGIYAVGPEVCAGIDPLADNSPRFAAVANPEMPPPLLPPPAPAPYMPPPPPPAVYVPPPATLPPPPADSYAAAPVMPPVASQPLPPPPPAPPRLYADQGPTPIAPEELPPMPPPPAAPLPPPPADQFATVPANPGPAREFVPPPPAPEYVPPPIPAPVPVPTPAPEVTVRPYQENINEQNRKDPYRWYSTVDGRRAGLRGGLN
jgi:curli production assembly/transport component CsgG/holdfast attachment protein HfaB